MSLYLCTHVRASLNFKHRRAFVEDCGLFYEIVGRVKRLTETETERSVTFSEHSWNKTWKVMVKCYIRIIRLLFSLE